MALLGEIIGDAKFTATFEIVVSIAATSALAVLRVSIVISFFTVISRCISRTAARAIASTAKNRQSSKMLIRKKRMIPMTIANSTMVAPRSPTLDELREKREPPTG